MAKSILKGLTVEIDGDTVGLVKALDKAQKEAKRLGDTADKLKKQLALNWDASAFERAQQAAQDALKATQDRAGALRQAMNSLDASGGKRAQRQMAELVNQLERAGREAEQARLRIQQINTVQLDHIIQKANALSENLLKTGAQLTKTFTTPLQLAANHAVEAASAFVQTQADVGRAFGDSAILIEAWAKSAMENFGLSQLTALQCAGQFMALANNMGVAHDAGMEMSTALTGLSADMASFYNIQQAVAADALAGIFTGESQALAQFGVTMNESALAAYALSQGVRTAYADLTQGEQVMLRYQYVTEALSLAQGDFARNTDSLSNQQRILQEQCKGLAIEFGMELLPIARDVVAWINGMVQAFSGLTEGQQQAVLVIAACAAALGPLMTLMGGVSQAAGAAVSLWRAFSQAQIAATAATLAGTSATQAYTAALLANSTVQAVVTGGISLLIVALGGLIAHLFSSAGEMDNFKSRAQELDDRMKDIAQNGFESAGAELVKLDHIAQSVVPRIEELANKTNRTAEETQELQSLISMLNQQLGYEAASFDAATGAVNMNSQAIMSNIQMLRQRAVAKAAEKEFDKLAAEYFELEKERKELNEKLTKNTLAQNKQTSLGLEASVGLIQEREDIKSELVENSVTKAAVNRNMVTIARDFMFVSDAGGLSQAGLPSNSASGVDPVKRAKNQDAFDAEMEAYQYSRQIGTMSERDYARKLFEATNKHFYDDKETWKKYYAEYRQIVAREEDSITDTVRTGGGARVAATRSALAGQTAEVKNAYSQQTQMVQEAYEKQKQAASDAYERQKQAAKDAYDAQIKQIDSELAAKEAAINAEIKAIDKAMEARKRQKQEDSYDQQINALRANIDYGGGKFDEFTLSELRAQLSGLEQERADYRWELEQEDRKAELQEELENARILADEQKAALQEMYDQQLAAMEEEYQMHLEQLDAVFKTADGEFKQISEEFISAMQAGAESAAAALRAAISSAYTAAADLERGRAANSAGATDARTYSPQVTLNNSGYSERQVARIVDRLTYE